MTDDPPVTDKRLAVVHLSDPLWATRDKGRYLFLLLEVLRRGGFQVTLDAPPGLGPGLAETKFTAPLLRRLPPDRGAEASGRRPDVRVLLSDHETPGTRERGVRLWRFVPGQRLSIEGRGRYDRLFPYTMHPRFVAKGLDGGGARFRDGPRPIGILFAGNVAARYDNAHIRDHHRMMTRPEIVGALRSGLGRNEFHEATRVAELTGPTRLDLAAKLVLADSAQGVRVERGDWLPLVSRARFFLAPPGLDMPLCHNIVEAMSVGTIPITPYPDYFDPPLADGAACLAFNDAASLFWAVRRALAMPPEAVAALSRRVAAHHDAHLALDGFAARLRADDAAVLRIGANFMPDADERRSIVRCGANSE